MRPSRARAFSSAGTLKKSEQARHASSLGRPNGAVYASIEWYEPACAANPSLDRGNPLKGARHSMQPVRLPRSHVERFN